MATVKETAGKFGVAERTVQRWAKTRVLNAHKEGRRWVIAEGGHKGRKGSQVRETNRVKRSERYFKNEKGKRLGSYSANRSERARSRG